MNDLLWVVRFGPSFSPPQEPHYRDEVEGPSHVQDEICAVWPVLLASAGATLQG